MAVNRFAHMFNEQDSASLPQNSGIPTGFALCPLFHVPVQAGQQLCLLQEVYRQAYEQARVKAWRARLEKRFFSVWN